MFKDNKYTRWYYRIISASRRIIKTGYVEKHHIIPRSLGGSDDIENLVSLTAREHYICHLLLPKMVIQARHVYQMACAYQLMSNENDKFKQRYTSRLYHYHRPMISNLRSINMTGANNHFYDKTHSTETRLKISKNNATKRDDVKQKMRKPRYEGFKPHNHYTGWDEEIKNKISQSLKGNRLSDETKSKMSKTRKNKVWICHPSLKSKHISNDDVCQYISDGWFRGRKFNPDYLL